MSALQQTFLSRPSSVGEWGTEAQVLKHIFAEIQIVARESAYVHG